jgi:hypothetical protein
MADPDSLERLIEAGRRKAQAEAKAAATGATNKRAFMAGDVAMSGVRGAAKGIIGTPGAPFDIARLGQIARAYVEGGTASPFHRKEYAGKNADQVLNLQDAEREAGTRGLTPFMPKPSTMARWGGQGWIDSAKRYVPPLGDEAQSSAGALTERLAEAGTGAAMGGIAGGGRGLAREAIGGLAAGGAQELAGAAGAGPGWQTAAGLIAGPLAASYGTRHAPEALRRGVGAGGVTPQQVQQAERLFQRAQSEGLRITRANALDWVTGGNAQGMSELQRVVESSGSPDMRRFFADNAPPADTRVRAYGNRVLDTIGPESREPSTIGNRVGGVMDEHIAQTERDVNAQVRPQYQGFEARQTSPQQMQQLLADPAFARAYQTVMTEPDYAQLRQGLPPDSVAMIDLTRRAMEERRTNLTTPGGSPEGMSATRAGGLAGPVARAQDAASQASMPGGPVQPLPGIPSPLQQAQQDRAILQQTEIDPLKYGPEGGMARAGSVEQGSTGQVEGAVFPKAPSEGSHREIGRAVSALAQQDPALASEMVRNYLGTRFSAATGRNVGGEPYTAGTKFWKEVAGNDQQTQNLQAAVEALPNGQSTWAGVREMGNLFEVMGKRQNPGSKTAFNAEDIENLKGKGWTDAGIKMAASMGTAIPRMGQEAWGRFRLGRNMEEVARLITDPNAGQEFARIMATTEPGSAARLYRYAQLLAQSTRLQQATEPLVRDPQTQPPTEEPMAFTVRPQPPEAP